MFLLAATSVNKLPLQALIPLLSLIPDKLHYFSLLYMLGLITGLLSFFLGTFDILAEWLGCCLKHLFVSIWSSECMESSYCQSRTPQLSILTDKDY